jgi:tRNA 2-thiouridine synthesizing protein A
MPERDAEEEIDLSGLLCPLPVLKARKRLESMAPGGILKVIATDPMAAVDMLHFCNEQEHALLSQEKLGEAFIFRIKRK